MFFTQHSIVVQLLVNVIFVFRTRVLHPDTSTTLQLLVNNANMKYIDGKHSDRLQYDKARELENVYH